MSGRHRSGGKLFQIWRPAAEKLRSPKRVRVLETTHVSTSAERRRRRNLSEEARMQSSTNMQFRLKIHQNTTSYYFCCRFGLCQRPSWTKVSVRDLHGRRSLSESFMDEGLCQRPSFVHSFIHSFVRSFTHSFIRSFTHSFVHSFIHSFIRSFVRSLIHSFIRSFIHSFVRSFVHSLIHSFIRSFIHSFIHSFVRSFVRSFTHSFIHSFIHSFTHSFILSFIRSFIHSFVRSFVHSLIREFHGRRSLVETETSTKSKNWLCFDEFLIRHIYQPNDSVY